MALFSNTFNVPDFATHYYHPDDQPFRNLSDLEPNELKGVLNKLNSRKKHDAANKRVFGSRYMQFRYETETKLRELFVERGGEPEREHPHYFVLGECDWFSGLYSNSRMVQLALGGLNEKIVSFTYPDSFIAMRLGEKYGLPAHPLEPYHNKVFLLQELEPIVKRFGLPDGSDGGYDDYHTRKFEKYIEIQVWSDQPISGFLNANCF